MQHTYKGLLRATQKERGARARTDLDAYLAGFFDGEGHISISRDMRRPYSCYVTLGVTNTSLVALRMFVLAYGGKIVPKKKGRLGKKNCYVWRCYTGKDISWALFRMLPWLKVKLKRARVALIVLQNRPLDCVGGQISKYQMMAITKALKRERITCVKNQTHVKGVPVTPMVQISPA